MNSTLVAAAGEYYVAYKLSCLGYMTALVRQGSPAADLLVSNAEGSRTVAVQVKTTTFAGRTRGRGAAKVADHLEFPLGHAAVEKASPKLIFCFVDLQQNSLEIPPDVYVVPGSVIIAYYKRINIRQHNYFRHHPTVEHMIPFKNEWKPVIKALS